MKLLVIQRVTTDSFVNNVLVLWGKETIKLSIRSVFEYVPLVLWWHDIQEYIQSQRRMTNFLGVIRRFLWKSTVITDRRLTAAINSDINTILAIPTGFTSSPFYSIATKLPTRVSLYLSTRLCIDDSSNSTVVLYKQWPHNPEQRHLRPTPATWEHNIKKEKYDTSGCHVAILAASTVTSLPFLSLSCLSTFCLDAIVCRVVKKQSGPHAETGLSTPP